MISVSDPPSVRKTVPDPAAGSGDGARISSARCDVLVEADPVFRVVLRLDFHKTLVIRSKTGAGQRGTLFAVAGEVEIDAAVMAEALRRRPTIAGPGNVCGIVARIRTDTLQRIHPPQRESADTRSLRRTLRGHPPEGPP